MTSTNPMGIHDLLRASDVKRWTIVRTVVDQSVAEHTFNVVMIARRIAKLLNVPDEMIIKGALEHDLDEIMTGDMPSPIKQKMRECGFETTSLENKPDRGKLIHDIVKIADYMECIWFLQENGTGRHATTVLHWIKDRKDKMVVDMTPKLVAASRRVWVEMTKGQYTI